ncbi:MAG TPA: glycosyltransferase family 39 protein [Acidobacteriaceae bacterium]|nr:glycosyltransferase family 39 protein [Acidobacteriaceae bacterium]
MVVQGDVALRRRHRAEWRAVALILAAGLAQRLYYLFLPVTVDDDTAAYTQLAHNWFRHGVYGFVHAGHIVPSLIRLPGYPLFLGVVFAVFGPDNIRAALILQGLIDLGACWLLFDCLRAEVSSRAAWAGLLLAAFCPFTAAYSVDGMTESLSMACISLAIWSLARFVRAARAGRTTVAPLLALAAATGCATLLRPDGVLLLVVFAAAAFWYGSEGLGVARSLRLAVFAAALAALPLVPWTLRNERTFHQLQPLAPREANNPGEFTPSGFHRWLRTWSIDFVDTANVAWNQSGVIDPQDIPARACSTAQECSETMALIAEHNRLHDVTPALDAQFAALAAQRIRERPWDYYLAMPALRVADMWLRPRTELFDIDDDWWAFADHPADSVIAILLGLMNLGYVVLAIVGFARRRVPLAGALLAYILLRSVVLATMPDPEQRYTMEYFPMLILAAACVFAGDRRNAGEDASAAVPEVPADTAA